MRGYFLFWLVISHYSGKSLFFNGLSSICWEKWQMSSGIYTPKCNQHFLPFTSANNFYQNLMASHNRAQVFNQSCFGGVTETAFIKSDIWSHDVCIPSAVIQFGCMTHGFAAGLLQELHRLLPFVLFVLLTHLQRGSLLLVFYVLWLGNNINISRLLSTAMVVEWNVIQYVIIHMCFV